MTSDSRRDFLKLGAKTVIAAGAASILPPSIARALSLPALSATGTIKDVKHVVILMQENRSFDHYFGTLRGVRGYGDPRPIPLPGGQPVWYQPDGLSNGSYVLPFHMDTNTTSAQQLGDLPHAWSDQHAAWDNGAMDGWIGAKGPNSMGYFQRNDIPYHFALADAFTVCDAYHASVISCTDPNRYYLWTGWAGNDGNGGGPVLGDEEAGYNWTTYPELLLAAKVSWKVYQDPGVGLNAAGYWGWTNDPFIGNFGDNSLLYFMNYQNAQPGSALYTNAVTGYSLADLKQDVMNGSLPQVSWITAPQAFCEHPEMTPGYGAKYISEVLDALTSNPEVWGSTVFILNYDENDGFFDHCSPPVPPSGSAQGVSTVDTSNEFFAGNANYNAGQYGLGFRVPMIVISPWSKGGWVSSQVFDHTSVIMFLEKCFGVHEPNITAWRRSICGDLTSLFNFANPNAQIPSLPDTSHYTELADLQSQYPAPVPPSVQALPVQEAGLRPARAVPYELHAQCRMDAVNDMLWIDFTNNGTVGVSFNVYASDGYGGPWFITVGAGESASYSWSGESYSYMVFAPNGFLRIFSGDLNAAADTSAGNPNVALCYDVANGNVQLTLKNTGTAACTFTVQANAYSNESRTHTVAAKSSVTDYWNLASSYSWYDLSVVCSSSDGFLQRFAGHVETGQNSMSDPAIITNNSMR